MPRLPSDQPDDFAVVGETPSVAGDPNASGDAPVPVASIERTPLPGASNVASVGYDQTSAKLVVEFKDGEIYAYANVPSYVMIEMITAKSPGQYFQRKIAMAYDYVQVQ